MPDNYTLTKRDKAYVDISVASFASPNPITDDLSVLRNERAINNAIKNLVMIIPSEVPFNYDIGSTAQRSLFDLATEANATLLQFEIERAILYGEPRVTFDQPTEEEVPDAFNYQNSNDPRASEIFQSNNLGVTVVARIDQNEYEVTVMYRIVGSEKIIEVQQILTPTR